MVTGCKDDQYDAHVLTRFAYFNSRKYGVATRSMWGRLRTLEAKLAEAEWLIQHLCDHEGAEGWSEYLRDRLGKYEYITTKD